MLFNSQQKIIMVLGKQHDINVPDTMTTTQIINLSNISRFAFNKNIESLIDKEFIKRKKFFKEKNNFYYLYKISDKGLGLYENIRKFWN